MNGAWGAKVSHKLPRLIQVLKCIQKTQVIADQGFGRQDGGFDLDPVAGHQGEPWAGKIVRVDGAFTLGVSIILKTRMVMELMMTSILTMLLTKVSFTRPKAFLILGHKKTHYVGLNDQGVAQTYRMQWRILLKHSVNLFQANYFSNKTTIDIHLW